MTRLWPFNPKKEALGLHDPHAIASRRPHQGRAGPLRWAWIPLLLALLIVAQRPWKGAAEPIPQGLVISEFMAADERTLADGEGRHTGWIEIHNPGAADVDLTGWYLTDDERNLRRWRFPETRLPARGYLIVYASGADLKEAGGELHTNFRLANSGEYLALVRPDGDTISWAYPTYPTQYEDVSYGVVSGAAGSPPYHERYLVAPTPGQANESQPANLGPVLSQAQHRPEVLHADDNLQVHVAAEGVSAPVVSVTLHARVMYGPTHVVPMTGDREGRYTATIPAALYAPGEMVRYYISARDGAGHSSRWPLYHNPTNSAQYLGTMVVDPSVESELPVLYWFVQDPYAATTDAGTRASLFYAPATPPGGQASVGRLYDNVFVRRRGVTSKSVPKKSYKLDFNQGDLLTWATDQRPVEEINLISTYDDKAYIRQPLAWETYRDAGVPYCNSFPVRVQQNGAFYSVAIWVEQPGPRYLERQGLDPEGALYKVRLNSFDSSTKGLRKITRLDEDRSDLQAAIDGVHQEGPERTAFLFDHFDLPSLVNLMAATTIIGDRDWGHKNVYIYRDTRGTGEWALLPWDKDISFGRQYLLDQGGILNDVIWANHDPESDPLHCYTSSDLIDALLDTPVIREMYLRRLRTLMDRFLQPPGTPPHKLYYERRISALYAQMQQDVLLDAQRWPVNWGEPQTFEHALEVLKQEYLAARRVHLYETHGPGIDAGVEPASTEVPGPQAARPQMAFGALEANPASGNQDQEYLTLVNEGEVAVDLSGWTLSGDIQYTFRPGVVLPAGATLYLTPDTTAFRGRATSPTGGEGHFVQGNYRGNLSNRWGVLTLSSAQGQVVARKLFFSLEWDSPPT